MPMKAAPEVTVLASFLAALALQNGAHRQSRRIQLLGARVEGRLDLGECRVPASLWFFRCVFDTTPLLDGARIQGGLAFPDCELPGLLAERCRVAQDLSLNAGCSIASEVRLQQARIAGDFNATRLSLIGHDASLPARRTARRAARGTRRSRPANRSSSALRSSSSSTTSSERPMAAAVSTRVAPGMGTTPGPKLSSHASATCAAPTSCFSAIAESTGSR